MNDRSAPKGAPEISPPSSIHDHCTEPVIIGALLPSAVMSVVIAENIARGTIEYPDTEVEK